MTDLVFLDSNVVLYLMDNREPTKNQQAREWLSRLIEARILIVSPQVLNEVYWIGRQKFPQVPSTS